MRDEKTHDYDAFFAEKIQTRCAVWRICQDDFLQTVMLRVMRYYCLLELETAAESLRVIIDIVHLNS